MAFPRVLYSLHPFTKIISSGGLLSIVKGILIIPIALAAVKQYFLLFFNLSGPCSPRRSLRESQAHAHDALEPGRWPGVQTVLSSAASLLGLRPSSSFLQQEELDSPGPPEPQAVTESAGACQVEIRAPLDSTIFGCISI